ncbi:6-pyruvoyl tetrahydropterin synthase [Solimonas aquatica]|uniref:6-carboxy-5,6,7,8-tetrahydropterin synthase n=1 Tax=Solimonas aquatica TaxID=489703 RepID=A0A1H9CIF9_9GAMM|nr:6-carboxytetrahydropterin synthase [Solimonas aquatica]SEQ00807.1 6-pyruvoyl tetrahydropterin synthase [Solimonas aquatica]
MASLFVDNLSVIDCAYLDAQRGLVGESFLVDVVLDGPLDAQSMVLDFSQTKRRLKAGIDASLDHRLLVPRQLPGLRIQEDGAQLHLQLDAAPGRYEHRSPASAVCLLDAARIDTETVAAALQRQLQPLLPPAIRLHLNLRHEAIEGAYYHYAHGLKKHAGLCRHIAHGHRSRVELRVDGVRDRALEAQLAARWRDIYLGTQADLLDRGDGQLHFAYQACDGAYELRLPESRVQLLDCDSTVEEIAAWLHRELAPLRAGHRLQVRAYEGWGKGAIAG